MILFWLWTRSQWLSLTIWLYQDYTFLEVNWWWLWYRIFSLSTATWAMAAWAIAENWLLARALNIEHLSNVRCTHTHTKRPMWFHKRFPMLISSTEIQLISVTHPYPDSMCSFKPRNWGDEKHARSYPVQSNQYHFLVHASTALCCHMILPPKIVIDSNWFHHLFWDLLASHSPTATLPASCRFWFSLLWQPFKAPSSIS